MGAFILLGAMPLIIAGAWGGAFAMYGHLWPLIVLIFVVIGSSFCSAFIGEAARNQGVYLKSTPRMRPSKPHAIISLSKPRFLDVQLYSSIGHQQHDNDRCEVQGNPNVAYPPTSLEDLRRKYGTRRSLWGDWDSAATRKFYIEQLPKSLQG